MALKAGKKDLCLERRGWKEREREEGNLLVEWVRAVAVNKSFAGQNLLTQKSAVIASISRWLALSDLNAS